MSGRILNTELKEFDATNLTGSYQNFGSALSNPSMKVQFLNTSDVDIYVSADGSTNKWRIPAGTQITLDGPQQIPNRGQEYFLEKGTQLEVVEVSGAGSSGHLIAHITTRAL